MTFSVGFVELDVYSNLLAGMGWQVSIKGCAGRIFAIIFGKLNVRKLVLPRKTGIKVSP